MPGRGDDVLKNTYIPFSWCIGYGPSGKEEEVPVDSDEAMESYIEQKRHEFHEEWHEYIKNSYYN